MLLFARVDVLGVAWLRIASAALIFAAWRRPWRAFAAQDREGRRLLLAWGAVLAVMNVCFYSAIDRLPLGTVAAIEFLPVIVLAALGARTPRNALALALAVPGVYLLTGVQVDVAPLGLAFAFANAALFALYIVLADRVAKRDAIGGIDGLAASMVIAAVVVTPMGGWAGDRGVRRPGRAAGGRRRGHLLVGHPVHRRPARARPPAARDVRAARLAAAGDRDGDRDRRAQPGPVARRDRRRRARRRRRRAAPSAGVAAAGATAYARSPATSHSHGGMLDAAAGPRCGQPFMIASSCQ